MAGRPPAFVRPYVRCRDEALAARRALQQGDQQPRPGRVRVDPAAVGGDPPPWAPVRAAVPHPGARLRRGRTLIVALLYGQESGWVPNLRAGDGRGVRGGRTYEAA